MITKIKLEQVENEFDFRGSTLVSIDDDALAQKVLTAVTECITKVLEREQRLDEASAVNLQSRGATRTAGRPARQVRVIGITPGVSVSGLEVGEVYDSAATCSKLLGYSYNAVGSALSHAKRFEALTAVVRGVVFEYISGNTD